VLLGWDGARGEDRGCGATRHTCVYLINMMPRATYTMRTELCCRSVKEERESAGQAIHMFSAGLRSTTQGNSVEPSSPLPRDSIPNIHTSCLNQYNVRIYLLATFSLVCGEPLVILIS
jgi:hypothetical protein